MHSPQKMRAFYRNLFVCGLLWTCPVCAERISEHRRQELVCAVDNNPDLKPVLITLTLQHDARDRLSVLLPALLDSYRFLKAGRKWQEFADDHGWVGSVRGLETTHGFSNGWHPHLHVMAFTRYSDHSGIEPFLKERWSEVLQHHKQTADYSHGVRVRDGARDIAEYVGKFGHEPIDRKRPFKWSMESELTKSVLKRSRSDKGRTPIELLADYAMGDVRSGILWKEYSAVFKGRNQLVWSRGLRDLLGLGKPVTDGEAAKAEPDDLVLLAILSLLQWKIICEKEKRGGVLKVAQAGDINLLNAYLREIGAAV